MKTATTCALLLAGCSFDKSGSQLTPGEIDASTPSIDASTDASMIDASPVDAEVPDAMPDMPDAQVPVIADDVVHVLVADEFGGATIDDDLTLASPATIDTSALTISGVTLPAGIVFAAVTQDSSTPGAPELAILHVDDLTISAPVRIVGTRPFVVVASGAISITADLDAGARRNLPGAGGYDPGMGPGPGGPGVHDGTIEDSGGGGAGYATVGGRGGNVNCDFSGCNAYGGAGGIIVSSALITTLRGGSGGGAAASNAGCIFPPAGAGGGSIQLYAATSISITATLNVGGGGGGQGENGADEPTCTTYSSASGGGSGGSIYLQTPTLTISGGLYANGGAGGGSAGSTNDGTAGADGGIDTSSANGTGGGAYGADGGDGGGSAKNAEQGVDVGGSSNGGGGGGSAGRIAIRTKNALTGTPTASPVANVGTY